MRRLNHEALTIILRIRRVAEEIKSGSEFEDFFEFTTGWTSDINISFVFITQHFKNPIFVQKQLFLQI